MIAELKGRRVALAHHWLRAMRGGEKTLQEIAGLTGYPPLFTLLTEPDRLSEELRRCPMQASFLQQIPWLRQRYRMLLPLMPLAASRMDLTGFDVVVCSDAAVAKGMRCRPDALKICYCYSPTRYIWDMYEQYRREAGWIGGTALSASVRWLRRWDWRAAQTVTAFVAISACVRDRIRRNYGRGSVIIYPPANLAVSHAEGEPDDFYLVVTELVGYKRTDLAIEACNRLKRRLVVIGDGPQMPRLRAVAGPTVSLFGYQDDAVVHDHMRRCRALLFCGEEDFGLVPVEVQSFGRPVIAYGVGGACETVIDGCTGLWFARQTAEAVAEAIERFERVSHTLWPPARIAQHARQFDASRFRDRLARFIRWCLAEFDRAGPEGVGDAIESLPPDHFLHQQS
jgi:glycosyltransferase involved in cell wall biosynthesis